MSDIRVTIRGEDFAAVSEKLVALGVTFQVEPLGGEDLTASNRAAVTRAGTTKRKPAKKGAPERAPAPTGGAAEAAARLRAMAERNRAAGGRAGEEQAETTRPPPFDTDS